MRMTTTLVALAMLGGAAAAEEPLPPHAVRIGAPFAPKAEPVIHGSEVPTTPMAEWEVDTRGAKAVQIVWGKDAVAKAPPQASRYEAKQFDFPTGTIRVLEFHKNAGGMLHEITRENALFVLKGTGTVEVAGKTTKLAAGDAVNYPSGVLRGSGDATVLVWTVTGTEKNEASPAQVVRARDAKTTNSAEWDAGGKRVHANTPADLAKAPRDAIRLSVTRYAFPGNSIRVAHNKKGGPTSPGTSPLDALIYVTSGKLKFYEDGQEYDAGPGDAIREIAGAQHYWYRVEDSAFVAISSLPVEGAKKVNSTER